MQSFEGRTTHKNSTSVRESSAAPLTDTIQASYGIMGLGLWNDFIKRLQELDPEAKIDPRKLDTPMSFEVRGFSRSLEPTDITSVTNLENEAWAIEVTPHENGLIAKFQNVKERFSVGPGIAPIIFDKTEISPGILVRNPYFSAHTVNLDPAHRHNFVDSFDLTSFPQGKTNRELIEQVRPVHSGIPFDPGQFESNATSKLSALRSGVLNLNADLGAQHVLRNVLRHTVVTSPDMDGREQASYVIVSHGHAIAILAELSGMVRTLQNGQRETLFDVSAYMPMGGWGSNFARTACAGEATQVWGDVIQRNRAEHSKDGLGWAGGVAVGLNGHRGDKDDSAGWGAANIDPNLVFGSPREFARNLQERGLHRLVILTEHYVEDPDRANIHALETLQRSRSDTFDLANSDLYAWAKSLKDDFGVEVIVASCEHRRAEA